MEVAASSASHDLHDKLNVYRRNGVREYLVWRTLDEEERRRYAAELPRWEGAAAEETEPEAAPA